MSQIAECLQRAADAATTLHAELRTCYRWCEPVALEMVLSRMLERSAKMQRELSRLAKEAVDEAEQGAPLACVFCGKLIDTVGEAIEADWLPSYGDGDDECEGPVCPNCTQTRLVLDEASGWHLKRPEAISSSEPVESQSDSPQTLT